MRMAPTPICSPRSQAMSMSRTRLRTGFADDHGQGQDSIDVICLSITALQICNMRTSGIVVISLEEPLHVGHNSPHGGSGSRLIARAE